MIAVEMMMKKLEEGFDKATAATFAYTSTAFPMLTGTLVTVAGFVPVGFAKSGAGEYCFTLFAVVAIALLVSWVVAVLFTPLTGVLHPARQDEGPRRARRLELLPVVPRHARCRPAPAYLVLAATAGLFVLSLVGMRFVQQQFFPASDRPELLVEPDPAAERLAARHAGDRRPGREDPEGRPGRRALELLRRPGRGPLLSAARRAARQRLLRAGRRRHQGLRRAPRRPRPAGEGARRRVSTTCSCASARSSSGRRSAGR